MAAIVPLSMIPCYSWACFHNAFILPYSLDSFYPEMKHGLYAIKWPNLITGYRLLVGPTRGLVFWTPFLVMAGIGYSKLMVHNKPLFWLTYGAPLLQVIVISGRTWDWQAGPSIGARYLAPTLPLLALPCALGVKRFPRIGMILAFYSVGITTLATLVDASPGSDVYNPLLDFHIPLFWRGELSPNLGLLLGLSPFESVALFYTMVLGGVLYLWRNVCIEEVVRVQASAKEFNAA